MRESDFAVFWQAERIRNDDGWRCIYKCAWGQAPVSARPRTGPETGYIRIYSHTLLHKPVDTHRHTRNGCCAAGTRRKLVLPPSLDDGRPGTLSSLTQFDVVE
eukprot:264271-Prymnesium_polylepis.1